MAGAGERHWLGSFLPAGEPGFGAGSRGRGTARMWSTCILVRDLGPGLAPSLPTKFFSELVARGPCLSPGLEPPACQERPQHLRRQRWVQRGRAGLSFVKL